MTRTALLLAAASAALTAASPALARPMTATDMHMMHRLGAPSVSPDGRIAIFTLSTTDLAANKRDNPVMMLDLSQRRRSAGRPRPPKGAHAAVFGADGAIWYLAPVKDRDQLFRMALGGKPAQIVQISAPTFRASR